jgi:hypothetical protein
MWMFQGSRAWSQWGVVHRFHVLLACRKFWFSNIGGHQRQGDPGRAHASDSTELRRLKFRLWRAHAVSQALTDVFNNALTTPHVPASQEELAALLPRGAGSTAPTNPPTDETLAQMQPFREGAPRRNDQRVQTNSANHGEDGEWSLSDLEEDLSASQLRSIETDCSSQDEVRTPHWLTEPTRRVVVREARATGSLMLSDTC